MTIHPKQIVVWRDADGRIHVRTSSQPPFIVKQKLCHVFNLPASVMRVFTERVGGGFGGKQEMVTEDLCVFAAVRTGRPVKWEFTREEQFTAATTRHQMTTRVKLGARSDGTLTAIELRVVSNTGAYGGHASKTLAASLASPMTVYSAPNKKAAGYAVYTNLVPGGGFRGYGASQTTYAIECAMDDLAEKLGMDPIAIRRANMIKPGDWMDHLVRTLRRRFRQLRPRPMHGRRAGRPRQRPRRAETRGRRLVRRHGDRPGDAGMRSAHRASLDGRDAPQA